MAAHTSLLRQRYRVETRIGQGGSGAVYRARDLVADQTVAIKQIAFSAETEREALAREAHLLTQLSHPGLPSVSDFFVDGNDAFMVMTFVPGADLARQLSQRATPFSARTVLAWADDVLDALIYLHTRQPPVVHRDIKPRNLKLAANGRVVLLDFGLARASVELTHAGYTLRYAPLEQVRGQATDARADLFALGATLYELLGRRSPVDAVERASALSRGEADPLAPLRALAPSVPESVAEVVAHALALHPHQRPATARAMRVALDEAVNGPVTVLIEAVPVAHPEPTPPSGTVTFLATELTASDASNADLARHDSHLRAAIDTHGGFVVRSSTHGVTAAFATGEAALTAALEAQRKLRSLSIRMALQTGAAQRTSGEYVSHALPRVARLLGAAHAGQIVLGDATRGLVVGQLPAGTTLRDLGSHHLPELAQPEHVHQVVAADLPAEFPPLRSPQVRGLPLSLAGGPPIGREVELTELAERLRNPSTRLVTLTGPAGVGKTTLATFVGEALLDDFPAGVYFIPLAPVHAPHLVLPAIAEVVGVPRDSGLETVAAELSAREALLVLDNFEHVLTAAHVVGELLDAAPGLKVLATSRAPLGLPDEHMRPVEPLAPASAIELFLARARSVEPRLTLDDQSALAIARLCARLDGLPLAIELAAARSDLFTTAALLRHLERGLAVLTTRRAGRPPRQQTLRAALAWSFELLSADEQRLFTRLGAFVGGWDLEAAENVCAVAGDSGLGVAAGLANLMTHSLVRVTRGPQPDTTRYDMLETVREYAVERLQASPEDAQTRQRQAAYFVELVEAGDAELGGPRMGAWVARLAAEDPNVRAALGWLEANSAVDDALRLAGALWRFWQVHGHVTEGRAWLDRLLLRDPAEPSGARARALVGAGALAWRAQDTPSAKRWLAQARDACAAVDDQAGLATALKYLGVIALKGPPADHAAAAELFQASLQVRRQLDDLDGIASCLNDLGVLACDLSDYARARLFLDESLDICRSLGNRYGLSFVLNNLSLVALNEGAYARVPPLLHESLGLARELGSREKIACALTGFASLAAVNADPRGAARLFGAAESLRETIGVPMAPAEQVAHDRHLAYARAALDPSTWNAAMAEGRNADLEQVLAGVNDFTDLAPSQA